MKRILWTAALLGVATAGPASGEEAKRDALVSEWRHFIAAKISIETLQKGSSIYTDRPGAVETAPEELAGWTLVTIPSELRMAKAEGLCFTIDRPARVYVGNHEKISQPPDWLKNQFEKTAMKIKAHQPAHPTRPEMRWNFELWGKSFPAGLVALGPNKNEALPHIVLVEKGVRVTDAHYSGPIPPPWTREMKEGGLVYEDRPYVLKDVPAELRGATLLAMKQAYALEDGRYTGPHLRVPWLDTAGREVRLARDVMAYVAYDGTSASVPEWMKKAGFQKTNLVLKVAAMKVFDDRPMVVYAKAFKADEKLWLGPNRASGWDGWPLQYLAMLKPMGDER